MAQSLIVYTLGQVRMKGTLIIHGVELPGGRKHPGLERWLIYVSTLFLAAGLDPARATLFRQSQVPAHRELAYLLECTAYTGGLNRIIQYKQQGRGVASTPASPWTASPPVTHL